MKKHIFVRTQFEALHRWENAPAEVSFLKHYHRHMFHVELLMSVTNVDRELEFILVKRALEAFIKAHIPAKSGLSCEMMAVGIVEWAETTYGRRQKIRCSVSEDGENGAMVET